MSNNLMNLQFDGRGVRIVMKDGEPWWVAKDVAERIEIVWKGLSSIQHVPEDWRGVLSDGTPGGEQEMLCLSEQGLYFFLARSDKPKALPFQKWIAGEILPQIRKTGSYGVMQKLDSYMIDDPIGRADRWKEEKLQLIAAEKALAVAQPKIEAFDLFLQSKTTLGLRDTAKLIGMKPGQFFKWIKAQKINYRGKTQKIKQPYLDNGWFKQSIFTQTLHDGARLRYQARVTATGIAGLREMAKSQGMLVEQMEIQDMHFALESQGISDNNDNLQIETENLFE